MAPNQFIQSEEDCEVRNQKKKTYHSPKLNRLGDIRSIVLGPSPGTGESGAPTIFKSSGPTPNYLPPFDE